MRNRTITTDQLLRMDLGLGKDGYLDDRPKKIGTMLRIQEIHMLINEISPDQDQVSSFVDKQAEFSKSP
ncbi:MAG: hypothetical protein EZS28_021265, partial [Streblomastix strix]